MTPTFSSAVADRLAALSELADRYPLYVPVSAAAEFLHVKEPGLRASIEQGTCPFGISWKLGDRAAYKIPTITFIAWLTKGAYTLSA